MFGRIPEGQNTQVRSWPINDRVDLRLLPQLPQNHT
jgi:hypothetical protein